MTAEEDEILRHAYDELELRVQERTRRLFQINRALHSEIEERRRMEEALRIQRDLAVALSSTSDLDVALNGLLERTLQLDGIDSGGIYLVDQSSGDLHLVSHRGLSAQFVARVLHDQADSPFMQRVMQTSSVAYRSSDVIPGLEMVRQYEGMRAIIGVPVRYEGRVIAVLTLASHRYYDIPTSSRTALESIAAQMGGVIVRIEAGAERARAEEALRTAHDELEQRVQERTAQLNSVIEKLQTEMSERERISTEREQAEQALAESEERYRTLVETSPEAILLTNPDGTIRFCNQQAVRLFGYASVNDLCGRKGRSLLACEVFPPGSLAPPPHFPSVLEMGNRWTIEAQMQRKDGTTFPAEVSTAVIPDQQGNATALTVVVRDMSEQKQAEQSMQTICASLKELNEDLRHSRNVLRALFDGLEDGLLLLDGTGNIQAANRSMAELLTQSTEDLVGQSWEAVYPRLVGHRTGGDSHRLRAAPPCDEAAWPPRASLSTVSQRTRYTPPGGATRILDIQTIALHTPDRTVNQMIVHVVDVTEHVQMEARLIENERFAASGRLAASVAHEINTPLQSLQTFVKLARNAATDADRDTFLDYARDEIQRVGRIVRQLLELYRPDTPAPGPVDMIVLIERIILFIGKRIRDQKITVERRFADALPRAWGHSDELTQVLLNLIVNALDAMPYGGPLRIAAQMTDDRQHPLEISITDGGCGIAPELQERIFEPFVTTKEHGTGLGLAISAQIIRQHGGDISVESQAGAGSTFTIRLPTSRPEGADPEDQQHAHAPHDGGAATTDKDKG